MGVKVQLGRLTSLLLSKTPLSVSKRDITDGRCWCAGGIKIRITSDSRRSRTRERLMIRPRPECVGEDSQPLLTEVTSLETTGGVFRPSFGRVTSSASIICSNHGQVSDEVLDGINPGFLTGVWFGDRWLSRTEGDRIR